MLNQKFQVIYQNESYMIDPLCLASSSRKFDELIKNQEQNLENLQLRVDCDQFTKRNFNNFLKICQNQQTDVQNSELDQICLLAKMFQAEKIYETGINFIHASVDPSFTIPHTEFDEENGKQYLILEPITPIHHANLNELEFDDSCERFETETTENRVNNASQNQNQSQPQKKKLHSTYYQITSDNPFLKCTRYYFSKDNKVLYMAKVKNDEIFIGPGTNFHISENKLQNTARIKRDIDGYNIVNTDEQEFKIRFIRATEKYSMNLTFVNNGSKLNWKPREARRPTSFNGEFNHQPIPSKRNIILQNPKNHPTLIVRKMSKKMFEAECHPAVKPLNVFAIALSQILGPVLI